MGKDTKIEWAHHTFNPWMGCTKVSPGCDHCYAEEWANRFGAVEWGAGKKRSKSSARNWDQPLKWNTASAANAENGGDRHRVFCASLADVFDKEVPDGWRDDLFGLIGMTAHLDWLLLTKRPNFTRLYLDGLEEVLRRVRNGAPYVRRKRVARLAEMDWPLPNVWLGVTAENQDLADQRIPILLSAPAVHHFVSYEPALGPVDFSRYLSGPGPSIDWIIAGGESGRNARPAHPDWFRSVRDQCDHTGTAFFFKQWGEWAPGSSAHDERDVACFENGDTQTANWFRHGSKEEHHGVARMWQAGKKRSGRLLDGRTWDEFPACLEVSVK